MCAAGPHVLLDVSPPVRRFQNSLNGGFHLEAECGSQPYPSIFVIFGGLKIFKMCVWMKIMVHRPTERRTSASTCSPGMAAACPDRISSRRRMASAIQRR